MGLVSLKSEEQKLESGATEVKKKIGSLYNDITFLNGIIEDIKSPEDVMNSFNCLSNMHKKICDVIHVIQYFSIVSRSRSWTTTAGITNTVHNIGPLEITLPSCRKSKAGQIISSSLDDLNQIVMRCNSLQGKIKLHLNDPNLIIKDECENDNGSCDAYYSSINEIEQSQMEFNRLVLNQAMAKIVTISEDSEDNLHILRSVIEWDDEKDSETRTSSPGIRLRWIKSLSSGEKDLNENLDYNALWNRTQKINSSSNSSTRRYLSKLKLPIMLGLLLSITAITVFIKLAP